MAIPPGFLTSVDEERYVESFLKREGIRLDIEAIKPNAAKRCLAKLCLYSMSGKLTERYYRTRTKIITEPHELYRFLATPGVEVTNLAFASDDVVWLSWKLSAEENVPYLTHTDDVFGSYVTAGAIIHLYSFLDQLQENAIYCDTDSVIFIQARANPGLSQQGQSGGHAISTKILRLYNRVRQVGKKIMHTG